MKCSSGLSPRLGQLKIPSTIHTDSCLDNSMLRAQTAGGGGDPSHLSQGMEGSWPVRSLIHRQVRRPRGTTLSSRL